MFKDTSDASVQAHASVCALLSRAMVVVMKGSPNSSPITPAGGGRRRYLPDAADAQHCVTFISPARPSVNTVLEGERAPTLDNPCVWLPRLQHVKLARAFAFNVSLSHLYAPSCRVH